MRHSIHHHYDQLTDKERRFVDDVFSMGRGAAMAELADYWGVPLKGDDTVERAVDALARAVIESREEAKK